MTGSEHGLRLSLIKYSAFGRRGFMPDNNMLVIRQVVGQMERGMLSRKHRGVSGRLI
jgi:hypothetical protein